MFYEIFRNDPDPNPDNTETDRSGFTTPWTQQNVRKYIYKIYNNSKSESVEQQQHWW